MGQIDFQCACGRRLRATTVLVGKAIECRGCGVRVVVPEKSSFGDQISIGGETISTAEWVRAKCTCGKVLKAPPKMAGLSGTCPRCGQSVKMPQSSPDDSFSGASKAGATAFELLYEHDHNQATRMGSAISPDKKSGETAVKKALTGSSVSANPIVDQSRSVAADSPDVAEPVAESPVAQDVQVKCNCGGVVTRSASTDGKVAKCPKCGEDVVMPDAPAPVPDAVPPPKPSDEVRSASQEGDVKLPPDFVVTARTKDADRKRRQKIYEESKRKGGAGESIELGLKGLLLLPFRLIMARNEMSPVTKMGVGLVLLVIACCLMTYNWPADYVDAQHQWAVPRQYYYNLSDNRLMELGDMEFQQVARNLLTKQPDAASYIVRAYVYACGSCDTAPHQIMFLERFTPEALNASFEFEDLIRRGVGDNSQTRSLSTAIAHGHFIGRFVDPSPSQVKPASTQTPIATTAPHATTQPASAEPGSIVTATTSPVGGTVERPVLLDKINWLAFDSGTALISSPIPGCKDRANQCLPEPK